MGGKTRVATFMSASREANIKRRFSEGEEGSKTADQADVELTVGGTNGEPSAVTSPESCAL